MYGWLGCRRTDWFVLTPLDGAWSRIRITGLVYRDPITSRGYLYPSNISFEDCWTGVVSYRGGMVGVKKKSDQIDLRYACLYNNNACLFFYFASMFEVVNTLLEAQYRMTSRLHFVMRVRARQSSLV